jgi:hypothetical protein
MFTDEQRLIFSYEVRGVKRWADPLAVRRNLLRASAGEIYELCQKAARPADSEHGPDEDPGVALDRAEAGGKLHAIACAAFGLPPFDPATGEGITEFETGELLSDFWGWLEGNAKPAGKPQPSPGGTGFPPASPATTSPTSGSC